MCVDSKILVIDAGNTVIKWACFSGDSVIERGVLPDDPVELVLPVTIDCLYLASVLHVDATFELKQRLQQFWPGVPLVELRSSEMACGVTNGYSDPERLGVDRWLGVLAAYHRYRQSLILIDAGTAVKVEFVTANAHYQGGYIVPGMRLLEASLINNTGRIRYTDADMMSSGGVPNNTGLAVRVGCEQMLLALVAQLALQYPHRLFVFTGGDGLMLQRAHVDSVYEADLVFDGAKLLGDEMRRA